MKLKTILLLALAVALSGCGPSDLAVRDAGVQWSDPTQQQLRAMGDALARDPNLANVDPGVLAKYAAHSPALADAMAALGMSAPRTPTIGASK